LYSMSATFSADKMDLGRMNIVESYIDLRDKEPVYTQQFRLPMEQIKFIKENVMGWLDAGIFKRENSPYNSPIFCVPKKQGHGLRCVLDFRRLNLKTMISKYSIRCIDQCLEEVGKAGSKIFSCLDRCNGFWNQVLREFYTEVRSSRHQAKCSWCKKLGHTYKQCWPKDPTLRPPHLQVKSVGNALAHGNS
jgi:hypothetical protein